MYIYIYFESPARTMYIMLELRTKLHQNIKIDLTV